MDLKEFFLQFTPLGRANLEVEEHLKDRVEDEKLREYRISLKRYRDLSLIQTAFRILLYASIITSIIATFGFKQIQVIQQVASYFGTTMIIVMYGIAKYFTMVAKESYHVKREIIIAESS